MRGLVPLAILISVVNAYFDETPDYWYSNDDGLKDNLVPIERSYNSTIKEITRSIKEVHQDLFSQRNENLQSLRKRRGDKSNFIVAVNFNNLSGNRVKQRIFWPGNKGIIYAVNFNNLSGKKLKKGITWPAGDKDCAYGSSTTIDCNTCICMAPMVYICSSNLCETKEKNQLLKRECVDGAPVKSRDCNSCMCLGGTIICTLVMCDVKKLKLKELTKLKDSIREKDGVQCIQGDGPIKVGCNICGCMGGKLGCTLMGCGTGKSKLRLKSAPKLDKCLKGTWYSPSGDLNCRPCYCLDEHVSFCFAGHCNWNERGVTIPSKPTECVPGKKLKKGLCTLCECSRENNWVCNTNFKNCKERIATEDDAYSLGTATSCHGCSYRNGVWDCYVAKSRCNDYDTRSMSSKTVFLNNKGPCSACYSDPKAGNVCATDVKCASKLYAKAEPIGECLSDATCKKSCFQFKHIKIKRIGRCVDNMCMCI